MNQKYYINEKKQITLLVLKSEKLKKIKETYHKVAKEAEEKIMKNNITNINQIYENEKLRKNINNTNINAFNNKTPIMINTNEKNKIQGKKYLKKSVKKILSNDFKNNQPSTTISSSYQINTKNFNIMPNNFSKENNIDNIISSFNKVNFDELNKKPTNISLINNSLILNYMNKINNNISVNSNNISLNNSVLYFGSFFCSASISAFDKLIFELFSFLLLIISKK